MPSYYELIKQSKLAGGSGGGPQPILVPKLAIENGTYYPVDDEADGYSSVTVNVPDVNDIAFVPPQKFKSDGSALADYKIYGSNGVKTENKTAVLPLTFTAKAGNAVDWTISGNNDIGENLFDGNYQQALVNPNTALYLTNPTCRASVIPCNPNTTYTISTWDGRNRLIAADAETYPENNATVNNITNYGLDIPQYVTFTTSANAHYMICYVSNQSNTPIISIVKGSTAPDHYIPYQKGVGERTENLFDVNEATPVTSYRFMAYTFICEPNTKYTMTQNENMLQIDIYTDSTKSELLFRAFSTASYTFNSGNHESIFIRVDEPTAQGDYREKEIMLVRGSTAPQTYIPYGYQIPLTVSQTGQPDKTVDIYIGDSPLTEGETVSKQSTGVDLELFEGENTVSTTLYNKPETAITYTISTGVGEEVSGSYRIPVTINSTTTNVPIGDTPLIEDEYVSYAEQKIYKYVDSVLTPVDPPSALPQISTANGENELSIETEIQPDLVDVALLTPIELIPVALGTKTISVNDTYDASDDSLDGYSSVVVNVPEKVLTTKTITESGIYNAEDDNADGYSSVTVNISRYNETLVDRVTDNVEEVT